MDQAMDIRLLFFPGQASLLDADVSERKRDDVIDVMASTLSKTEVMVLNFYQEGFKFTIEGSGTLKHVETYIIQSRGCAELTIMQILWRLERPFQEFVLAEYNVWRPGDGNQKLEFLICDY